MSTKRVISSPSPTIKPVKISDGAKALLDDLHRVSGRTRLHILNAAVRQYCMAELSRQNQESAEDMAGSVGV